jgi:Pyruvate/2-oxoacid:ferredoxin oxidoreductase gamma subunit
MLGAFVKVTRLVAIESVIAILPEVFGAGRKNLVAINEQCLRAGYDSLEGAENGHQADHR